MRILVYRVAFKPQLKLVCSIEVVFSRSKIQRIGRLNKGVVESNDLGIVALERFARDNAAEAVDTDFDYHHISTWYR